MSRLCLTFACCRYDRMEAIRDASVVPEGVELNCLTLGSGREVFDRMVGGQEFDIAELSAAEFISLAGGASSALFSIFMIHLADSEAAFVPLWASLIGVVVTVALMVLYMGTVCYTTSDRRLQDAHGSTARQPSPSPVK